MICPRCGTVRKNYGALGARESTQTQLPWGGGKSRLDGFCVQTFRFVFSRWKPLSGRQTRGQLAAGAQLNTFAVRV